MSDQKHIINKQVLEIRLNDKKDAHLIQDAFSRAYWNHIPPVIERIIDKYSSKNEIIKIDKLEIDIGGISIDKLNSNFPQKVEKLLEEIIIAQLHKSKINNIWTNESKDDKRYSEQDRNYLQIKTETENQIEILNHFLLTGILPWWVSKTQQFSIQKVVEELLEKSPFELKRLLSTALQDHNGRKRFIYQFSEKTIIKTAQILFPFIAKPLIEFYEKLITLQSHYPFTNISEKTFKIILLDSILEYSIANENTSNANSRIISEFLNLFIEQLNQISDTKATSIKESNSLLKSISESIDKELANYYNNDLVELKLNIISLLDNSVSPEIINNSDNKKIANHKSSEKLYLDIFSHFIQTGRLPDENYEKNNLSIQQIVKELLAKSPEKFRGILLEHIKDVTTRKRFIHQFPADILNETLQLFFTTETNTVIEHIEALTVIQHQNPFINIPETTFKNHILNSVLAYAAHKIDWANYKRIDEKDFITWIIANLLVLTNGNITQTDTQNLLSAIKKSIKNIDINILNKSLTKIESSINLAIHDIDGTNNIINSLEQSTQNIENNFTFDKVDVNNQKIEDKNFNKISPKKSVDEKQITSKIRLNDDDVEIKSTQKIIQQDEIVDTTKKKNLILLAKPEVESELIKNAGLVLVWPFLVMFFERLNLIKDKKFINDEAGYRAIHFLQYLATEQEETPENDLLFNKLLCGVDIYAPIPLSFSISENEKEECNALLQSLIENWKVLKNTSIQTLRVTFLQREGLLCKQSGGWKLNIERTTIDILLDRLPWGISMIRLPWSNKMIYVEW
ncbi:MAG: hypothetical protein HXX16_11505 [Bacteroidales bacterium]|nr:hypothetical protein [Bacteroidales bacterium]